MNRAVGVVVIATIVFVSTLATSGSAGVTWRGDYETGDFKQWDFGVQQKESGRATIVTSPVRQGKYAARYEVRPGDNNVAGSGGGERTEALASRSFGEGEEQWWAWSTMFAPDFSASASGWNTFTQWHNYGPTGGTVSFTVSGNTLRFQTFGGSLSNPTRRSCNIANKTNGKWYDIVFHVKWSANPNTGFAEVWVNGNKVVEFTKTPTLYNGQGVYLKQGYYREPQPNVGVIYHDGMREGTSYADVTAEFPGGSTSVSNARLGLGGCLPKAPSNTIAPEINGVLKPGRELKASPGSWSDAPTRLRYQWQASRDGSRWRNLRGAIGRSLVLPATFSAPHVRVWVTASNSVGSGTVVSAPVGKSLVVNPPPRPAGSASIAQNIRAGQTLKGTIVWKAVPASPVKQIVFAMDSNKANRLDASPPYEYVIDTTKLTDGKHTFGLTVTQLDGTIVWKPYQIGTVIVDNHNG